MCGHSVLCSLLILVSGTQTYVRTVLSENVVVCVHTFRDAGEIGDRRQVVPV